MTHVVLVPGSNHGGWWYVPVVEALAALGHTATVVTLSGLDPDGTPAPGANLDTHVGEVDAFVPEDGDSCSSMTNEWQRQWDLNGAATSDLAVEPLPFFDPRSRPHPIGTLLQRSRLTGAWRSVARKTYALAVDPGWLTQSPFVPTADRPRDDPEWSVVGLAATHNVLRDGPDLVLDLLRPLLERGPDH